MSTPKHGHDDDFLFEESGMLIEEIMERMHAEVKKMSPKEKAELRYELEADMRMPKRVLLALACSDRVN